jgi:hypothetical protein
MTTPLQQFQTFTQRVLGYSRICGVYILEAAAVPESAQAGAEQEAFLRRFAAGVGFTEPDVGDAEWKASEVFREDALEALVEALVGGAPIGHSRWDVPPEHARPLANDFLNLFGEDARFFCAGFHAGAGAQPLQPNGRADIGGYIFSSGCVAIDRHLAAVFWILDND